MCLGIPGQIVEVVDAAEYLAKVDVSGVRRVISTRLLADDPPDVGTWVLVHVGFAMAIIDEAEAKATLDQVQRMGQDFADEFAAFASSDLSPGIPAGTSAGTSAVTSAVNTEERTLR